jgi:hypothetical protein
MVTKGQRAPRENYAKTVAITIATVIVVASMSALAE